MRHKVAGYKLGRNTAHRRSLLRNLVTSVIVEERIETTVPKAKAAKPIVEKMITLGKRGDLAARRLAAAYLMTDEAVVKLFDTVGPRFGMARSARPSPLVVLEACSAPFAYMARSAFGTGAPVLRSAT